jgi:hypothetical protein
MTAVSTSYCQKYQNDAMSNRLTYFGRGKFESFYGGTVLQQYGFFSYLQRFD